MEALAPPACCRGGRSPPLMRAVTWFRWNFTAGESARPGRAPPKAWRRLPSVAARTLDSSRSIRRPAATAMPSPPERRKQSLQTNDCALPGASARGGSCRGRDLGLNDEQGGSGAVDCQGQGAVGHRQLGPGEKTHCRQAIGVVGISSRERRHRCPEDGANPPRRSSMTVQSAGER